MQVPLQEPCNIQTCPCAAMALFHVNIPLNSRGKHWEWYLNFWNRSYPTLGNQTAKNAEPLKPVQRTHTHTPFKQKARRDETIKLETVKGAGAIVSNVSAKPCGGNPQPVPLCKCKLDNTLDPYFMACQIVLLFILIHVERNPIFPKSRLNWAFSKYHNVFNFDSP